MNYICNYLLVHPAGMIGKIRAWAWALLPLASGALLMKPKTWDVALTHRGERHVLQVRESQSVLAAAEEAGLLPGSDCRRGRCLSCAARVRGGPPFSLCVDEDTALCTEAHVDGIVLLCSAFPRGPGVELALGAEGDAWEIQHSQRWQSDAVSPPPREERAPTPHFHDPDDLMVHLERCHSTRRARGSEEQGRASGEA